jgi:serine/threonine-protein kinase
MRRRIEREARALAAVSHPNIVAVYDYGEARTDGNLKPYVVMELVEGPDLERHLRDKGPLPVDEAVGLLRGILAAVARAHEAGIVHGDLKPANVLLAPGGPKVGDFGVARILAEETGTTTVAATPSFAAPEVLRGERPTPASDVYSAACLAFQMLAGRPPYEGTNAWEVAARHMEDPVPLVSHVRPDVLPWLADAVRQGMEKDPKRRHRTVAAFAAELDAAPATVPLVSSGGDAPGEAGREAPREATEVLPGRPDLRWAAVLGPLAGWGDRIARRPPGARSPLLLAGTLVVVLAILAVVLFSAGSGPRRVEVPDVRGMTSTAAAARLRQSGFRTDLSYRPVTTGEAGVVLETIPAGGQMIDEGAEVHIIASALARTAAPVVTEEPERVGKGKRNKDDD